jgi:hypothetical protein
LHPARAGPRFLQRAVQLGQLEQLLVQRGEIPKEHEQHAERELSRQESLRTHPHHERGA